MNETTLTYITNTTRQALNDNTWHTTMRYRWATLIGSECQWGNWTILTNEKQHTIVIVQDELGQYYHKETSTTKLHRLHLDNHTTMHNQLSTLANNPQTQE